MKANCLGVLAFILAFFLSSCGATKLMTTTKEAAKVDEKRIEASNTEALHLVDTTELCGVEVTYTKTEYYPPETGVLRGDSKAEPNADDSPGGSNIYIGVGSEEPKQPPDRRGAVRSVEQFTIKTATTKAGVTADITKTDAAKVEAIKSDTKKEESITEAPAPDPYRWRYILAIIIISIAVMVAGYFFLRKNKVVASVITLVKKFFVHR